MGLVQKSFSDIITFSRSSNATRVGPTGLVEYAPHNLLVRSQEFDNASWTKTNCTVTANAAAAPDGTVTSDQLAATSTICVIGESAGSLGVNTYTFSVFFKAGTTSWAALQISDTVANANGRYFDLASVAVGGGTGLNAGSTVSVVSSSITNVGNGWVRCSLTVSLSAATSYTAYVYVVNGNNSDTVTIGRTLFAWGAQLSVGPYALDYTPTTSAAVYGPRFDYDGSGVTIVEPVSRNLLVYSQEFDNAAWTKSNATVTANSTTSPDGTINADTITVSTSARAYVFQQQTMSSGTVLVGSIFLKAGNQANVCVTVGITNQVVRQWFNLSTITAGSSTTSSATKVSASISDMGNGWRRCTLAITASSANVDAQMLCDVVSADNVLSGIANDYVYAWGAQLEVGSTATGYMASGATNGFRAVPVVSGSATAKGLLVEEQRVNSITYSEQFDNAAWTKAFVSVTANAGASPDGTVNADLITPSITGSALGVYQSVVGNVSGTKYTLSVFAKASGKNFLLLGTDNNASYIGWFNLSSGTVGTMSSGYSGTITNYGNGWYRCVLTWDGSVGRNFPFVGLSDADGSASVTPSGSNGILVWGAQFESSASFATSYIPTLASTVTRSADVASVNTLSPWHNSVEGTLYAEGNFIAPTSSSSKGIATLVDNSAGNDSISIFGISSSNVKQEVLVGGASQASFTLGYSSNIKAATAYKANDTNAAVNGTTGTTDTSCTVPTVAKLQLGGIYNGTSFQLNGWLRRVAFYPRRLLDAEIQALTS